MPFCLSRCHYCDFAVSAVREVPWEEWLLALSLDLTQWFHDCGWTAPLKLETVFIGGGTPSLLGGEGMEQLATLLAGWFEWSEEVEWTAESNPSSLTGDLLRRWRAAGVNRLSVGVQAFDDRILTWLGRRHDARQSRAALRLARDAGFRGVNADLMFGLPGDLARDLRAEVRELLDLGVTHVSAYGLSIEPETPLGRRAQLGRLPRSDDARYGEEYLTIAEMLTRAGFVHYEVSNFALPGHECRHNWHYWEGTEYLGLGPSAHSLVGGRRMWNVTDWEAYRRAARGGVSLREGFERRSAEELRLERLWLGLRTRRGLPVADPVFRGLSPDEPPMADWFGAGWIERDGEQLRLSTTGWLRLDGLVAEMAGR